MLVTKPIDLLLLGRELTTAGVTVNGLGLSGFTPGTPDQQDLFTYDGNGQPTELPPEAVPVVNAHTHLPTVNYLRTDAVDRVIRTTDAAFHEIWRFATEFKHVYRAAVEMEAVDAGDGTSKASEARLVYKGLSASVVPVGTTVALWTAQDAAASTWAIQAQGQGTDLVIGVRGASGRTIDWMLSGEVRVFAPEGGL
jgi:hypothetical protein